MAGPTRATMRSRLDATRAFARARVEIDHQVFGGKLCDETIKIDGSCGWK